MNTFIIIATALISGLLASVFSFVVQRQSEKRKEKLEVFRTLMASRYLIWSDASVTALNSIDVVFYKNKNVRDAYTAFLNESEKPQDSNPNVFDKYLKLLEEISKALKLNDIHWDDIKKSYYPRALATRDIEETLLRKAQLQNATNQNTKGSVGSQFPLSPDQTSQVFDAIISQPELLKTIVNASLKK